MTVEPERPPSRWRWCLGLFLMSLVVYEVTSYGGIRSPDGEIAYRVGESLAHRGGFAVADDIPAWPRFGLAPGVDGRNYAVFGPALSLAVALPLKLAARLSFERWVADAAIDVPISHYVNGSLQRYIDSRPVDAPGPHALRWLAVQANILFGALSVVVFWLIVYRMTGSIAAAAVTAVLFGFGTLAWSYTGTFFRETLATLFALASFYFLVRNDPRLTADTPTPADGTLAGLMLGLGIAAHITVILFLPFFLLIVVRADFAQPSPGRLFRQSLLFLAGLLAVLALLALLNEARFGSLFETGRTVDAELARRMSYGTTVVPWEGLHGLTVSYGKGLLLFSPAVVLGLLFWRRLDKAAPFLSRVLLAGLIVRLLFMATRSDWHGGFALGPRYMVLALPFLLLPVGFLVRDAIRQHSWKFKTLAVFIWLCICQQLFLVLGEIFSFYHLAKWREAAAGRNFFYDKRVYFEAEFSPLFHILDGMRGPYLLRDLPVGNWTLWLIGCVAAGLALAAIVRLARRAG